MSFIDDAKKVETKAKVIIDALQKDPEAYLKSKRNIAIWVPFGAFAAGVIVGLFF